MPGEEEEAATIQPVSDAGFSRWVSELAAIEDPTELRAFATTRFAAAPEMHQLLHLRALLLRAYEAACDPSPERWDRIRLGHLALDSQGDGVVEATLRLFDDAGGHPESRGPDPASASMDPAPPHGHVRQTTGSPSRSSYAMPDVTPPPSAPRVPPSTSGIPQRENRLSATPPGPEPVTTKSLSVETEAIDLGAVAQLLKQSPAATPFTKPQTDGSTGAPPANVYAPHPQAGATEGIDEAAIQAAIAGSYPLPTASLDRLPLPLDRYGALVARSEAARGVAQLSALYAEYGVQDTAHRHRIDEEYRAVFEQHPELRSAFDDVVAQWRAYLRRG